MARVAISRNMIEKALRYEELYLEMQKLEEAFVEHCKKTKETLTIGNFSAKYRAPSGSNDYQAALTDAGITQEQLKPWRSEVVTYDLKAAAHEFGIKPVYTPGIGPGSVSFSVQTE